MMVGLARVQTIRSGVAGRGLASVALLGLLSACAGHSNMTGLSQPQEAVVYQSKARPNYAPPGPPEDPWGPYIVEASGRFDVPARWIRQVMRVESGAQEYQNDVLTTSPKGAMGLMQVMPETFDEVSARYDIPSDAYDPHNNILAGTAYLRELYDAFGSPGFLAAYNCGPTCLQNYLTRRSTLPDETRRYVAMIAPYIADAYPQKPSQATDLAMNRLPDNIPAGPRYGRPHTLYAARNRRGVMVASNERRGSSLGRLRISPATSADEVAEAPAPPVPPRAPNAQYAWAGTPSHTSHGFHLIAPAMAADAVVTRGGRADWKIQVGAYGAPGQAQQAAGAARARLTLAAHTEVMSVRQSHGVLYRARVGGLTHDGAVSACQRVRGPCIVVAPNS